MATPATPPDTPSGNIVFAHANGFPACSYRKLFEHWRAAGWNVHAPSKLGHDPRFPVTDNWTSLRDELLHFIERDVGQPSMLVGHSLGGYLSVMAASKRPDLARGVVMLDSPLLGGWKARVWQVIKATGEGERFTPGRLSKRRRQHWPSAQAAFDHFASKPLFARWDPDVLRDYIAAGTQAQGNQHALSFRRDVETAIYNTVPHHLTRVLRRHPLRCRAAFIGGTESAEVRQAGLGTTKQLVKDRIGWIQGGHLYPMERPTETAKRVLEALSAMATAPA